MFLHSFKIVLPPCSRSQNEIVDWTVEAHRRSQSFSTPDQEAERFLPLLRKFCVSEKLISRRYYECDEVDSNWDQHRVYRVTEKTPLGSDIHTRNKFFEEKAGRVFNEFYDQNIIPDHLIHVSCTGYVAPSPPQIYFSCRDKVPAITHAYHMGCYASLPAVRMAAALAVDQTVDVVHNEMCSLHLDLSHHTPEQMVVQTLFGDGHIKYSLSPECRGRGFRVLHIEERLVKNSLEDMSWVPGPHGMLMTLSREVPAKIQVGIEAFVKTLCDRANLEPAKILKESIFAIHPGGPKIIEAIKASLNLSDEQVASSKKVLFERGNMSSATLPHVWEDVLMKAHPGQRVVSLAFGPGLTMFGGIFEVV